VVLICEFCQLFCPLYGLKIGSISNGWWGVPVLRVDLSGAG
jgi:hypothetical protein